MNVIEILAFTILVILLTGMILIFVKILIDFIRNREGTLTMISVLVLVSLVIMLLLVITSYSSTKPVRAIDYRADQKAISINTKFS